MAQSTAVERRPGIQLPPLWRENYLRAYSESGLRWLSASKAGVSEATVSRHEAAEPAFAAEIEAARQAYADSLEGNMHRLATTKNNVVANIVLLKKHRPQDFVERRQELHLHAHAAVSDHEARAVLAAMLAQVTPATRAVLATPTHVPHTAGQVGELSTSGGGGIMRENDGERPAEDQAR